MHILKYSCEVNNGLLCIVIIYVTFVGLSEMSNYIFTPNIRRCYIFINDWHLAWCNYFRNYY